MDRNVNIITDLNGNKIVLINDIIFKGKRSVDWDDVKAYLEAYVGEFYEIADTKDIIYIGKELPDEYTGSRYTHTLKGANAKAKANASQGIPGRIWEKNTAGMPPMGGTDMIPILHCLCTAMMGKWNGIMCSMRLC